MATTKAPLFGLDASGTLAKSIVFSKWKGRNYVRRHAVPSNPNTPLQQSMRAAFKFLTQHWKSLSAAEKLVWETIANTKQTTGLDEYVGFNQRRQRFNLGMSIDNLAPGTGTTPSTCATFTASNGRKSSVLAWTAGANAPDYYWQICMDLIAIATCSVDTTIVILPAATLDFRVAPLLPGTTYHFDIRGVMKTGLTGGSFADVTATPTL
jgi:hypothetical protein